MTDLRYATRRAVTLLAATLLIPAATLMPGAAPAARAQEEAEAFTLAFALERARARLWENAHDSGAGAFDLVQVLVEVRPREGRLPGVFEPRQGDVVRLSFHGRGSRTWYDVIFDGTYPEGALVTWSVAVGQEGLIEEGLLLDSPAIEAAAVQEGADPPHSYRIVRVLNDYYRAPLVVFRDGVVLDAYRGIGATLNPPVGPDVHPDEPVPGVRPPS